MIDEKIDRLNQNQELRKLVASRQDTKQGNQKKLCILDLNGVLIEKDVTPKLNQLYQTKIRLMFDPLVTKSEPEVQTLLKTKGLEIKSTSRTPIAEQLREFVAETCFEPAKGTPSRKIAYDLAETAFDSKEITATEYPDAKPFCIRAAKTAELIVLSRGSESLLSKMVRASSLSPQIARTESTIPYGNAKTAETFIRYYLHQSSDGNQIAEFLEDEFDAILELVLASAWLGRQLKLPSLAFQIVWVDRDSELKEKKIQYKELTDWMQKNKFEPDQYLLRVETLEKLNPEN